VAATGAEAQQAGDALPPETMAFFWWEVGTHGFNDNWGNYGKRSVLLIDDNWGNYQFFFKKIDDNWGN
jgi:hypothetical protein